MLRVWPRTTRAIKTLQLIDGAQCFHRFDGTHLGQTVNDRRGYCTDTCGFFFTFLSFNETLSGGVRFRVSFRMPHPR